MPNALSRILGAAAFCSFATVTAIPAQAQQNPAEAAPVELPFTAPSEEALAFAQERGQLIYAYDQAAWHSTDVFVAGLDMEALGPFMRGYVVVPSQTEGALDAIYFADFGDGLVEVARYSVQGSEVVDGGFHPDDARPPLSPDAARLVNAREAAIMSLGQSSITICADAQPNLLVVPEGEGADVYIMSPLTSMDSLPLGGHYRFSVDGTGQVTQMHRLEDGCPTALLPELTEDMAAIILMPVEYERAAEPSEIHVWASMMRPVPLFVSTPRSRTTWVVDAGTIRELSEDDMSDAPPGIITAD